jgi:hypothetical protein
VCSMVFPSWMYCTILWTPSVPRMSLAQWFSRSPVSKHSQLSYALEDAVVLFSFIQQTQSAISAVSLSWLCDVQFH